MEKNSKLPFVIRLLIALLLAILFWYYVNGDTSVIVSRVINDIPVTFTNSDVLAENGLVLSSNVSYYVNLQVRGTEKNLDEINTKEITAEADLSSITTAGTYDVSVVTKGTANSIIISAIVPETITVTAEEITEKEWTPTIIPQGKPASGNTVISSTTSDTVTVSGPSDELAVLSSISGVVNVDGLNGDSSQYVRVRPYDADGNELTDITIEPDIVRAEVVLGITKEVNVTVPQVQGSTADGYKVTSVTVDPEKMTVAGKQDVLETVTSLSLDAVTIGDTNNASSFTVEESVKLPTGVTLIGDTDKVSVSVNIEQVVEKRFTIDSIETSNLGSGLKVSKIDASSVAIKVSGVTSELNELSTRNMKAVLDLNGKGEGTYSIPVTVEVPKGTVTEVSPKEISVTIVKSS